MKGPRRRIQKKLEQHLQNKPKFSMQQKTLLSTPSAPETAGVESVYSYSIKTLKTEMPN